VIPDEPTIPNLVIPNLPVTRRERQLEARTARSGGRATGWRFGWALYCVVATLVIVGAAFLAVASP